MSSLQIGGVVFGSILGGALLGVLIRRRLPEGHFCSETRDVVKLSMGLVGTMTALVLGLVVASAKSSFDAQRGGVVQVAAQVVLLDRTLAHYGPDAAPVREMLKAAVADLIRNTWPDEAVGDGGAQTYGRYEPVYDRIQALTPTTDAQRAAQAQAIKVANDIGQARWLLFAQQGSSIPVPFLVVMVTWFTLIMFSFGLFAPRNLVAVASLGIAALTVASAIFLVLELDRPFSGVITVSSGPMRHAYEQLGR